MGRVLRSLAAVAAGLALVAMLPAPCPCPEEATAPRSGHECCAPPTGVSSSDRGCCDEDDSAEADLLRSAPVPMPSLSEFAVVRVEPVARPERAPRRSVVLSPAPAPAVLRI